MARGIGVIEVPPIDVPVDAAIPVGGAPRLWASACSTFTNPAAQTRPAHANFHRNPFIGLFLHPWDTVGCPDLAIDALDPHQNIRAPWRVRDSGIRLRWERRDSALVSSHCFDERIAAGTLKSGSIDKYPESVNCAKSGESLFSPDSLE
ncbi:MAG: hypothetical protein ACLQGP_29830 [Isosphaeraceae bacterium]